MSISSASEEEKQSPPRPLHSPQAHSGDKITYSIKLMNAEKKSDFRIYNIRDGILFDSVASLSEFLKEKFEEFKESDGKLCVGYIEPGHGWKGKQQWINTDDDVKELYSIYRKKKNMLLWCYLAKSKKKFSDNDQPASKRAKCLQNNEEKSAEANKVLEDLKKKHGGNYRPEQLHAWAQLVQLKKHTSLEDPPDYPFFKGRKRKRCQEASDSDSVSAQ